MDLYMDMDIWGQADGVSALNREQGLGGVTSLDEGPPGVSEGGQHLRHPPNLLTRRPESHLIGLGHM